LFSESLERFKKPTEAWWAFSVLAPSILHAPAGNPADKQQTNSCVDTVLRSHEQVGDNGGSEWGGAVLWIFRSVWQAKLCTLCHTLFIRR
jgi:hypothetical protein